MKKYNVLRLVFLFSISLLPAVWSTVWSQALGEMVPDWSSVEHGPFHLVTPTGITNPVLTADDVTDVEAKYVADPFMFHENGTWYIFFEVLNVNSGHGDIGLATSSDGLQWNYEQIVLSEDWHLSYPLVLKYNGKYYMIPEMHVQNQVRVYEATDFPYNWTYVSTIASGREFRDASVFHYDGKWWMYVGGNNYSICYLYYSNELLSGWVEHPMSPIVDGDKSKARPGGRSFVFDNGRIIRITQKDDEYYGQRVRAFEVDILTETQYAEHEIPESPILYESGSGWNKSGMHHFDPWWNKDHWLCAVDGQDDRIWSIGIYRALDPLTDLIVSDLTVGSGEDYEVVDYGLMDGALTYIDRSHTFTDIPVYLEGATYIKTANDDKASVGDDFLSFDVNRDVTVYVAHDDFITDKPSWLLGFTDTGDQLVTTDKSLSIYARDFLTGTITLGGNEGPGQSMYVVVLVGKTCSAEDLIVSNPKVSSGGGGGCFIGTAASYGLFIKSIAF